MKINLELDEREVAVLIGMLTWYSANTKVHHDDAEQFRSLFINITTQYNKAKGRI
jgi:hypothetical protein